MISSPAPTTIETKLTTQSKTTLRHRLFVAAVLYSFALPHSGASAEEPVAAPNQKIAEITAMSRHNEKCPHIPRDWSIAYLTLLMTLPPTEKEVAVEERKTLALRREIGLGKWCQLYSVEMQQAYLIYQYITRR